MKVSEKRRNVGVKRIENDSIEYKLRVWDNQIVSWRKK